MRLKGSEDEIKHHLPVSSRSLLHLLGLLELRMISHWLSGTRSNVQLTCLEFCFPSLLDLVSEKRIKVSLNFTHANFCTVQIQRVRARAHTHTHTHTLKSLMSIEHHKTHNLCSLFQLHIRSRVKWLYISLLCHPPLCCQLVSGALLRKRAQRLT